MASNSIAFKTACLLLVIAVASQTTGAAFFQGAGSPTVISEANGKSFLFPESVKIFGNQYTKSNSFYLSKRNGRLILDSDTDISSFEKGTTALKKPAIFAFNIGGNRESEISTISLSYSEISDFTHVKSIVANNFIGESNFTPLKGFIAKWQELYLGGSSTIKATIELALVHSADKTFLLSYYQSIDTATSTNFYAGFGRGADSKELSDLPFHSQYIKDLETQSGTQNGTKGLFIYQIDSWPPVRGGCLSKMPQEVAHRLLSTSIHQDTMLGGATTIVSSVCHNAAMNSSAGSCILSMGDYEVDRSEAFVCKTCGKAFLACNIPPSFREGPATLKLSLKSEPAEFSSTFNILNPNSVTPEIAPSGDLLLWEQLNPQPSSGKLTVAWNDMGLEGVRKLEIIGYSEGDFPNGGTTKDVKEKTMDVMYTTADVTENKGTYAFDVRQNKCTNVALCEKYHIGFIRITDSQIPPRILQSRILPLGWFVNPSLGNNWADRKCIDMTNKESADTSDTSITKELLKQGCPQTEVGAIGDPSRYVQTMRCPRLPGGDCSKGFPVQRCYMSRFTLANVQGLPAACCCYNSDNGKLLFQEDMPSLGKAASTPESEWHASYAVRSHPVGVSAATFKAGQSTYLSHWYWDVLYFYYCCRWSSSVPNVACPFNYMKQRPTPKVSNYQPGRTSFLVGDPHVTSLSGLPYLFNGIGEFWLLKSNNFVVQGRFSKLSDAKLVNVTFFSAVAFRVGAATEDSVTIRMNTGADKASVPFIATMRPGKGDMTPQRLTITTTMPYIKGDISITARSNTEWVVQLTKGEESVGLNLHAYTDRGYMDILVAVSNTMKDKTSGLLGRWTDNAAQRFIVASNGEAVIFNEKADEFHTQFCQKNKLAEQYFIDSIFIYQTSTEQRSINSEYGYVPRFVSGGSDTQEILSACGATNNNCKFDYHVAGRDIAMLTKASTEKFTAGVDAAANVTATCDRPVILGILLSTDGSTPSMIEGDALELRTCVSGASLVNGKRIVCTKNSADQSLMWQPAVAGTECTVLRPQLVVGAGAGPGESVKEGGLPLFAIILIVAGCILLVVFIIIGIMVARKKPSSHDTELKPSPETGTLLVKPTPSARTAPPTASSRENIVKTTGGNVEKGYENQGHHQQQQPPKTQNQYRVEDDDDDEDSDRPKSYAKAQGEPVELEYTDEQRYNPKSSTHVSASADV